MAAVLVVPAQGGMLSNHTAAVASDDAARMQALVAFDRDTAEASIAATENRCRFTPSRNPVRPRRNECRLA